MSDTIKVANIGSQQVDAQIRFKKFDESWFVGLFIRDGHADSDVEPVISSPVVGELTDARRDAISKTLLTLATLTLNADEPDQPRIILAH